MGREREREREREKEGERERERGRKSTYTRTDAWTHGLMDGRVRDRWVGWMDKVGWIER